jgi:prepilin-type N-terminal cleavage/methylation domain-containing protein
MERAMQFERGKTMALRVPRRRQSLGFTLVELMTVVVMVGILAAIGISLFRQWVYHSRSVEAVGMIQSIRVAQERWRSENGNYLDVSSAMTTTYPMAAPGRTLYDWDQIGGDQYARWQLLNPTVSGPVMFGYVTKAGPPFTAMAVPTCVQKPVWPAVNDTLEPWYVIEGTGDTNDDGVKSYYVAASLNGEVYRENEGE